MTIKIGAGIAYYGGMHPEHAQCVRAVQHAGIPILEISGAPYPEVARAEVARHGLEYQADVVVFIDPDMVFTPDDVRMVASVAIAENAVATASAGRPKSGFPYVEIADRRLPEVVALELRPAPWDPSNMRDMAFTAVPRTILQKLAELDDRYYSNSAVIDTGFSKDSRAFFSPWKKNVGKFTTEPLESGVWCDPDRAFLCRVQAAGFEVLDVQHVRPRCLSGSGVIRRLRLGDKAKREAHQIEHNYAVCVPTFGALDRDQQAALWELEKAGVAIVELHGCPFIDVARGVLAQTVLDLDYEGVFFLDHDIIFRPCDALDIIREAEDRQDVVAAVYCMRKTAHALIGAIDVSIGDKVPFFEIGGVFPAYYSGMGFAAIPRAVFEALDQTGIPSLSLGVLGNARPYFALDSNGSFYCGEDVSFCNRVQGLTVKTRPGPAGEGTPNAIDWEVERSDDSPTRHKVWLDTRVRIFHRGGYDYGIEDHSFSVPRYAKIEATLTPDRASARAFHRTVDKLDAEARIRSQGLDEGAEAPHGTLV